jgi:pyruvate/2-oxoglutarate dehydrogenase complex dihydrolipoamide acyltransferase (E2) component
MNTAIEVKVPVENVNDTTAKLLTCVAQPGVAVTEGAIIAELETTKTTFDVMAPAAGLVEFLWSVGDEVPVGEVLCRIHTGGLPGPSACGSTPARADSSRPIAPELAAGPLSAMPPSPKSPTPAPAPPPSAPAPGLVQPVEPMIAGEPVPLSDPPVFSRRASELIKEHGLSLADFAGKTFVRQTDVELRLVHPAVPIPSKVTVKAAPAARPIVSTPTATPQPQVEGVLVPIERAKMFENRELLSADRAVLKSTLHFPCPASGLQNLCAAQSPPIQRLVVILHETAKLLASYRQMNACYYNEAMHQYENVNLGFAVDIDRGLKVLVIRNAQSLTFPELSARFEELLVRYSTNTLQISDLTGSTFTVTDLSAAGVHTFDPLINVNQAAILGIGADHPGPGGTSEFMLSCAFDHRLLGGRIVSEFMGELSRRLVAHAQSLRAAGPKTESAVPYCARCLRTATQIRDMDNMLVPSVEPIGHICSICFNGF